MRWEDDDLSSVGFPSRVVQYEAPDLGSDDVYGVWKIDDTDHSFSSQPFRIRYARQDVLLSLMISFNLPLDRSKGVSTSAVILKFELMYTAALGNRFTLQDSLDSPAAVHEFRIPPKALLGLHSYCPVHFDAFHSVLVDMSLHISLRKGGVHTYSTKLPRDFSVDKGVVGDKYDKSKQGHHLDLRLVRNQWLLMDPKVEFLMSEVNEEKTSGDFREMGLRLAQEVVTFMKKRMDKASRSGGLHNIKLSFVGHSIGNVILRTALAEDIMEPYLRYLYTYISISGPHLGYLYSSNSIFNSGLWLLKKLKWTQVIHQLTFSDDVDLQNTFFYKLSKQKTLDNFKNIILLSSPQDGYVPYHSARIEMCQASSGDYSKKGKVFLEMLNNCLDQIRAPSSEHRVFMRCDVNFDISLQGRNLNTFIGRAAHIEFLETDSFARFIMWSFPELFR